MIQKINRHLKTTVALIIILTCASMKGLAQDFGPDFLGAYDFIENKGNDLEFTCLPQEFKVEDYDGQKVLRIERTTIIPIERQFGQEDPTFPLINREKAREEKPFAIRLKILNKERKNINPKQPVDLLIVLKLYDIGYTSNYGGSPFKILGNRQGTEVAGSTSGTPYRPTDPLRKPRILEKTYLLPGVLLNGPYDGADIQIEVNSYLYLQAVEVYRRNKLFDFHESQIIPVTVKHLELYKRRALAEDKLIQTERIIDYLTGFGLSGFPSEKQVLKNLKENVAISFTDLEIAVDDFYYQGRLSAARNNQKKMDVLQSNIQKIMKEIEVLLARMEETTEKENIILYEKQKKLSSLYWFNPTASLVPPKGFVGGRINPLERIQILCSQQGYAPEKDLKKRLFWQACKSFGVTYRDIWYAQTADMAEDGIFASAENRDTVIGQEIYDGFSVGQGPPICWAFYFHSTCRDLPKWFVEKYEKTEDIWDWNGAGEVKRRVNAFNDKVLEYFAQYIRKTAEAYAKTPNYNYISIGGEAKQFLPANGACENGYSPSAKRKFREYLKTKYVTVENMNAVLGTSYASFAIVEPPPDCAIQMRRKPGPLDYDFERFRRGCLLNFMSMAKKVVKEVNPELLVWYDGGGQLDMPASFGLDTYNLFKIADIVQTHGGGYLNRVWNYSMARYNPQAVLGRGEHSEQSFLELFSGNRIISAWESDFMAAREYEGYGTFVYDGRYDIQPARSCGSIALLRKRADRLWPVLNNVKWRHPRVGMFYSPTTQMIGWPYQETEIEAYAMHNWLFYWGIPYFIINEDALVDTSENIFDYHVIVAPFATCLQKKMDDTYIRWVKEGGTLICSGPFGAYDEYGKPDLKLLKTVFGNMDIEYLTDEKSLTNNKLSARSIEYLKNEVGDLVTSGVIGWFWKISLKEKKPETRVLLELEDGTPVLLEGKSGNGRVFFSACGLGQNGLAKFTRQEIFRRVKPFACSKQPFGFLVFPLVDAVKHHYLGIMNIQDTPLRDTIKIDASINRVVDLGIDDGFPVPVKRCGLESEITLELPPKDGTILDLGMESDMRCEIRTDREDLELQEKSSVSAVEIEKAMISAEKSVLSAEAKREMFALASIGKLWFSKGAMEKANVYLTKSSQIKEAPVFYCFKEDNAFAKPVKKQVKIDGVLDEWENIQKYPLKGSSASGGAFMTMWDKERIYIGLIVRKEGELRECGEKGTGVSWRWSGYDGAVIRLNASDTCLWGPSGFDDTRFIQDGFSGIVLSAIDGRRAGSPSLTGIVPANVQVATKNIAGGFVMEISIPAREYHVLPIEGASIGFDIYLTGGEGHFCRYSKLGGGDEPNDGLRVGRLYFSR